MVIVTVLSKTQADCIINDDDDDDDDDDSALVVILSWSVVGYRK
jgi:hypothetical protein